MTCTHRAWSFLLMSMFVCVTEKHSHRCSSYQPPDIWLCKTPQPSDSRDHSPTHTQISHQTLIHHLSRSENTHYIPELQVHTAQSYQWNHIVGDDASKQRFDCVFLKCQTHKHYTSVTNSLNALKAVFKHTETDVVPGPETSPLSWWWGLWRTRSCLSALLCSEAVCPSCRSYRRDEGYTPSSRSPAHEHQRNIKITSHLKSWEGITWFDKVMYH